MASIARLTLATLIVSAPAIAQAVTQDPRSTVHHTNGQTALSWTRSWRSAPLPAESAGPARRARPAPSRTAARAAERGRPGQRRNAAAKPIPSWLRATLEAIAHCESRGDPRAVSSGGTYRGKYQFDLTTWSAVGGRGDPAAAPEALQDRMAARLYRIRGSAPWPVCGR
jgi:transglycosylase-like protein